MPEFAPLTVKVAVPHPLSPGLVSKVPNTNDGNTRSTVSPTSSGEFRAKMYVICDGASVTALWITNLLSWNAGVGAVTAVDAVIDPVVAAMFVAPCSTTPTVRVFRFAVCASWLVVTPLPTVTVHSDIAAKSAVVAVKVSVASVVPELVAAAVNPVDPHPLDVLSPPLSAALLPIVKVGSTSEMVSAVPVYTRGAFSSNVYDSEV